MSTNSCILADEADLPDELFVNPQTMGGREDLRYVRFSNDAGSSLLIETEGQVNMTALHHTDAEHAMLVAVAPEVLSELM